jgi:hypothetical protein
VGKGAAQFVCAPGDSLFMLGQIADDLIQGDQTVHSFRQVTVFKTLNVFRNVIYFFLQYWVQDFLFFRLSFDLVKLLDELQVIISVVLLFELLGKKIVAFL